MYKRRVVKRGVHRSPYVYENAKYVLLTDGTRFSALRGRELTDLLRRSFCKTKFFPLSYTETGHRCSGRSIAAVGRARVVLHRRNIVYKCDGRQRPGAEPLKTKY